MKTYLICLNAIFLLLSGCASSPPTKPEAIQRSDYRYLKTYLTWLI
ncbi:MAG: hypothetical protein HOO92_17575, partial [Methylococcaceae bacterium]|nr:hypothetical protein [Methylococcaceae bacterium]